MRFRGSCELRSALHSHWTAEMEIAPSKEPALAAAARRQVAGGGGRRGGAGGGEPVSLSRPFPSPLPLSSSQALQSLKILKPLKPQNPPQNPAPAKSQHPPPRQNPRAPGRTGRPWPMSASARSPSVSRSTATPSMAADMSTPVVVVVLLGFGRGQGMRWGTGRELWEAAERGRENQQKENRCNVDCLGGGGGRG